MKIDWDYIDDDLDSIYVMLWGGPAAARLMNMLSAVQKVIKETYEI